MTVNPTMPAYDRTAYLAQLRQRESSGNPNAVNSRSGATGTYQFLRSTWADLMRRRPELGLTPDGMTDPTQQERAVAAFTEENNSVLQNRLGRTPTAADSAGAHRLGATGYTRVASADPNTPLVDLVSPAAARANPDFAQHTAGSFVSMLNGDYNGATPTAAPAAPEIQEDRNASRIASAFPGADMPSDVQNTASTPAPAPAPTEQPEITSSDVAKELATLESFMPQNTDQRGMFERPDTWFNIAAGLFKGENLGDSLGNAAGAVGQSYSNDRRRNDDVAKQRSVLAQQAYRDMTSRRDKLTDRERQEAFAREGWTRDDARTARRDELTQQGYQLQEERLAASQRNAEQTQERLETTARNQQIQQYVRQGYTQADAALLADGKVTSPEDLTAVEQRRQQNEKLPSTVTKADDADFATFQEAEQARVNIGQARRQLEVKDKNDASYVDMDGFTPWVGTAAGMNNTIGARNYGSFQANMKGLVNDLLRQNRGVQTDGDRRAETEALINSLPQAATREEYLNRLNEIEARFRAASERSRNSIDRRRSEGNHRGFGWDSYKAPAPTQFLGDPTAAKEQQERAASQPTAPATGTRRPLGAFGGSN
ncbi:transglycosylase SLT domain-containing protein [Teichococcus vastitatis]|uniref:transglycosylase SLT domain-containing protein n=1 Tax=Teichococcus vastitatis TaxID=2307076 RepID=UPI002410A180|nr:transglycosylase SLT domain-containing protein [Pseudoroseomonas vastitatis]